MAQVSEVGRVIGSVARAAGGGRLQHHALTIDLLKLVVKRCARVLGLLGQASAHDMHVIVLISALFEAIKVG